MKRVWHTLEECAVAEEPCAKHGGRHGRGVRNPNTSGGDCGKAMVATLATVGTVAKVVAAVRWRRWRGRSSDGGVGAQ